jgi:predicted LPLAT superfamily acyltransferase
MSLIKRVCVYFWEVRVSKRQYSKKYLDSLYNIIPGDEWSQEDPFDDEFDDDFFFP